MRKEELSSENQQQSKEPAEDTAGGRSLPQNFTDLPGTNNAAQKPHNEPSTFLGHLKRDFKEPRFLLEIVALLVVGAYTWQAYTANRLTRKMLTVTQAAGFDWQIELRQQTNPWIIVTLTNKGKAPARIVAGKIEFTREDAQGKIIQTERRPFERPKVLSGSGFYEILPIDAPFDLQEFHREQFTVIASLGYDDGFGNHSTQSFCGGLVVEKAGGGWSYGWEDCDNAKARKQHPPGNQ